MTIKSFISQAELDSIDRELRKIFGQGLDSIDGLRELTPLQEGMFYAQLREDSGDAYVVQQHWQLEGQVEVVAMRRAYEDLVARHEVLRARIINASSGRAFQAFLKKSVGEWQFIDACASRNGEGRLTEAINKDRSRKFDLASSCLFRVTLIRSEDQRWSLLLSAHHVVLDGWSMRILLEELFDFYEARVHNRHAQLPTTVPFSRHLDWLRTQNETIIQEYWLRRLSGMDAAAKLPLKITPQALQRRSRQTVFAEMLNEQARITARNLGVGLNALTLTAWCLVLRMVSGAAEVVVGYVTSGRSGEVEGVERMVGMCLSTLPFRLVFNPNETLGDLVRRVQDLVTGDQAHGSVSLAHLQSELGFQGLFDHLYVFENYPLGKQNEKSVLGFEVQASSGDDPTDYSLDIAFHEFAGQLMVRLRWNALAFDDASWPERILQYLQRALSAVASQPQLQASELELVEEEERRRLLEEFNDTRMEYPAQLQVQELFEQVVDRSPERTALVFGEEQMSYGQLEEKANRLARTLRQEHGVGPDVLVGICLERSLEMVVGIMGVLKAGGAYVPLDPTYPVERLGFMLADSAVGVVLTKGALPAGLKFGGRVLDLDQADSYAAEATRLPRVGTSRNLAYVIYTSGSTGQPKGVMVEHRGLVSNLRWMQRHLRAGSEEVVLQKTPFTFDVSLWELLLPLVMGAKEVLMDVGAEREPDRILAIIQKQRVTALHFVPSLLRVYLQTLPADAFPTVKRCVCSGEALPWELSRDFLERTEGRVELSDMYGPTEATVHATAWVANNEAGRGSIGRPVGNTSIYILDSGQRLVPLGGVGELCIGGVQVARGYLNRAELTA
ncbi:MAG TPA: amino acid adenylation domain-containing protein, partial [Lacunisphaera sp.]|nr:amino acid adenylation domain-containing protein [Lacunisphaera sp.]